MAMEFVLCCIGGRRRWRFFVTRVAGVSVALQLFAGTAGSAEAQSSQGTVELNTGNAASNANANSAVQKGDQVNVKAYGAVGDGATDDTAAFEAALTSLADAGGGKCLVPTGTYVISASGIKSPVKSDVHIIGEGKGSILKIAAMPAGPLIAADGNNWSIENLTLDMQDYSPSRICPAIRCRGDNWRVTNCAILKIGRIGITVIGGDHWTIERNQISKTAPSQKLNECILVTKLGETRATNARITDNICVGSGIMFWGFNSTIARNRVTGSGFGSGIFTGMRMNAHALEIRDNVCSGGRGFDENRTWVSGFELWSPDSVVAGNVANDNDGAGIIIGGKNCIVVGNDAYDNGAHVSNRAGFMARYKNEDANASGSLFIGNKSHDQSYGYAEPPGRLHDIVHVGNDYNGNRTRPIDYRRARGQRNMSADQESSVIQTRISPEMRNKLNSIAQDTDLPDNARRAVRECLAR